MLRNNFGIINFQQNNALTSMKNPIQAKDIFENYEEIVENFQKGYAE